MKTRVLFSFLRIAALGGGLGACGITQGRLHVDTPIMQYQKPDISEITGIDEDDDDAGKAPAAAPASAPAPAPAPAKPATPGK